jgi:hypothetical protein
MSEGKPMEDRGPPMRLSIAKCGHVADVDRLIPSKQLLQGNLFAITP